MTPYTLDDIARYAEGEMPAEESQAFEKALAADDSLRQQLAFYHEVHNSLQQHFSKDAGQVQLEGTLQQMRGEFFKKETKTAKVVSINRYLRYAMGAAAVLLIALFLWKPWQQTELYEEYGQIKMIDPTVRGSADDSTIQKAVEDFNNKNYANAQVLLENIRIRQPRDSYIEFYYGACQVNKGLEMSQARETLTPVYNGESVFKYEAAFFIALSYLRENNKEAAREWLQKIPADAANYGKAQELLGKL
jgi:hypothetical protein